MFIRKSKYNELICQCEILQAVNDSYKQTLPYLREAIRHDLFDRIEERISVFTSNGNEDYARGFSDGIQQVEDRIKELKYELLGVD